MLRRMGHAPYQYPTPDGYADDETSWLGTLLWRWNFAAALAGDRIDGTHLEPAALRVDVRRRGWPSRSRARPTTDGGRARDPRRRDRISLPLLLASPAFQRY